MGKQRVHVKVANDRRQEG
uniref:Uncharacterized protein n=1 Tax=Rhizophora mucronata TaxID=61149 RepID=A0A2P2NVK0_RHIMU